MPTMIVYAVFCFKFHLKTLRYAVLEFVYDLYDLYCNVSKCKGDCALT